jgi:predicted DNA-binding ribbon-helix-helix protein
LKKRSVTLKGHRTSVTLEPAFWDALDAILAAKKTSLQRLIEEIDATRADTNLSSALRVFILKNK